jgi:hypothetical protein
MEPKYRFRISHKRTKKYDAVFDDGRIVSFGSFKRDGSPYQQFKDLTPLRAFRAYDHNDSERRSRYYKRHKTNYPKYTADWFSKAFLWN